MWANSEQQAYQECHPHAVMHHEDNLWTPRDVLVASFDCGSDSLNLNGGPPLEDFRH